MRYDNGENLLTSPLTLFATMGVSTTQNGHSESPTPANRVAHGETPENWVACGSGPAYERRKLKIACIGAGYSGLTLAHKIDHELKLSDMIDLTIYEKNPQVGGTWFENTYPGVAWSVISRFSTPSHA